MLQGWARIASEAIILALACLAPWAFGSVEAWSGLVLDLGIFAVAALGIFVGRSPDRPREILPVLPCLALLAVLQAMPIPARLLKLIDPASASARASALPEAPERVIGDPEPPVALPPATLSLQPEQSVHAAARLAAAWILLRGVIGLGTGFPGLRRFAIMMTVNAAAMAFFSLIQSLMWNGKIYGIRASPIATAWRTGGPFVGHNPLAAFLNLGLGMGLGVLLSAWYPGRRAARAWTVYAIGLTIVGLIASHSRSGLIASMAGTVAIGLVLRRRECAQAGLAIGAILGLAVVLLAVAGGKSSYDRLTSLADASAYADRLEIWEAALETWAVHPLLGTGLGTFAVASAPAFHRDQGVAFLRAENEYLDVMVEGGLVGLGIAMVGLALLFRSVARALRAAPSASDRALVAGGFFGLTTLAIQSLGDFSPHILGVAFPAVVLCGHLRGLGGAPRAIVPDRGPQPFRIGGVSARIAAAALALGILVHAFHRARSESWLAGSDVPPPGAGSPESIPKDVPRETLERMQVALEGALIDRPDWAEGYLRLGMVRLALYERLAADWVDEESDAPLSAEKLSDLLWLHATIHSTRPADRGSDGDAAAHEPVRLHLVPAARCFLQARRCSPVSAAPHAYLASLDYLLEGGGSTGDYAVRAFRLAGSESRLLLRIAQVAAQGKDLDLAARAWGRCIEVREDSWEMVADCAATALSADQILERALPPGACWPGRFANRLYSDPEDAEIRARYFEEAIRRLPDDTGLSESERLRIEATALAGLGNSARARALWEGALSLDPTRADWRQEVIGWLVDQGDIDAAHRHAVIGVGLNPGHHGLRHAVMTTAGMLARGHAVP